MGMIRALRLPLDVEHKRRFQRAARWCQGPGVNTLLIHGGKMMYDMALVLPPERRGPGAAALEPGPRSPLKEPGSAGPGGRPAPW